MSNEYKEWIKDRGEEAMDTIASIADITTYDDRDNEEKYQQICELLEEGGWL